MSDLAEFLLARITEDEKVARRATHQKLAGPSHGSWHAESLMLTESNLDTLDRRHIARFDPDRILAECEAKRRVVERCSAVDYAMPCTPLAHGVLSLLALPYADHPDYRKEWRPDR